MKFLRNHTLYLLCQFGVKLGSLTLRIFDRMAILWHTVMAFIMSSFPKARIQFTVYEPNAHYHPAMLITGTSSGIGHDAALAFASRGYTVFAGVRREEDGLRLCSDFQELLKPATIWNNRWQRSRIDSVINALWLRFTKCNAVYSLKEVPPPSSLVSNSESNSEDGGDDTSAAAQTVESGNLPTSTTLRRRRLRQQTAPRPSPAADTGDLLAQAQGQDSKKNPSIFQTLFGRLTYREMLERAGKIIPVIMDVTDDASVDQALEKIQERLVEEDIPLVALINNAGVSASGLMETASPRFIDESFSVNYLGPLRLTQKVLPWLRQSQGRIINVSSIMSWLIGPGFGVYCSSKAALTAASRSWRYELASFGVSLSVVEPGLTKTSIWNKLFAELQIHHSHLNQIHPFHAACPPQGKDQRRLSVPALPSSLLTVATDPSEVYGSMLKRISAHHELFPFLALPTDHVVDAMVHAISSQYPKGTYRVGWDARLLTMTTWFLSEDVIEWLCRVIGIVSEN